MTGFTRAQAEYEARLPDEPPLLSGRIVTYLTDGPFDGQEVEIDYELKDELVIFEVLDCENGEEIDPNEVTEKDRSSICDQIIENRD